MASAEAAKITGKDLVVFHSICLGLALNFSVAWYEVLQGPHETRVTLQERSRERIVEEIIDVPVPQMIRGNYGSCEAPVRGAQWSVSVFVLQTSFSATKLYSPVSLTDMSSRPSTPSDDIHD